MARDQGRDKTRRIEGALDKFEPAGDLGPIEHHTEYERRINSLPAEERQLALESTRFADLCQYFAQQKMDVPADIVAELGSVSKARHSRTHSSHEKAQSETHGVPQ
jgi:hypothetical protein